MQMEAPVQAMEAIEADAFAVELVLLREALYHGLHSRFLMRYTS